MTEFYNADVFDLDLMISNIDEVERDASERMRNIMWAVLAPNSKNQIKPEEVIHFSWDHQEDSSQLTTKEQFDEMCKKFKLNQL